jgi:hypothetical protein
MSKSVCFLTPGDLATSGGGHTLRSQDLGMILAWHRNRVSDVGHSAFVMKKMDGVESRSQFSGSLIDASRWHLPDFNFQVS